MNSPPKPSFPDFIQALPQPETAFPGVGAYLLAAPQAQAVFFELPAGIEVPPHSHCAQWGVIVEGEFEFNIGGRTRTYRKGEAYYIADGQTHGGKALTDCLVVDVFADPERYKGK